MSHENAKSTFSLTLGVVDDAGRPIEGAEIRVIDHNTVVGWCSGPYSRETIVTDAGGRVTIDGLEAERTFEEHYFVAIRHPDFAEGRVDRPEHLPREDGVAQAEVTLTAGHAVEGRLVAGRAAEGSLHLDLIDPQVPGCHHVLRYASISGDGTFRVTGLHPGRHTLCAKAPGGADVEREIQVPAEAPLVIELPVGRRVSGKVIGADGGPIEGIVVCAEWPGPYHYKQVTTDASGAFSIAGLPLGERLVVSAVKREPVSREAMGLAVLPPGEGDADLTFDARRRGTLRGRLHDDRSGEPLARGVEVQAAPVGMNVLFRGTGGEGDARFSISLPEGEYDIAFMTERESRPMAFAILRRVVIAAGETRDDLRVGAAAGLAVRVQVIDAETLAPLAGAAVSGSPGYVWHFFYEGHTDDGGIFVVAPAFEGPLEVWAEAPGYARTTVERIEVRRGMDPIVLKLYPVR